MDLTQLVPLLLKIVLPIIGLILIIWLALFILRKSNIKALQLEDEFGLPAHFKLPSLTVKK